MVKRGDVVLLDTMVILEAHRCRCWKGLLQAFSLESAERCMQELTPGGREVERVSSRWMRRRCGEG